MLQQTWLQLAQSAAAGSASTLQDEAICTVLAKVDQELSNVNAANMDDCRAYADLDGFLVQQVLAPAASARLQALTCQVLVKLSGLPVSPARPALVDFHRLWKQATERDESAVRLMPVVATCRDPELLRDSIIPQLVRWVSTRGFESGLQKVALLALTRITARQADVITDEQVLIISCQLAEWLKGAGTAQATSPTKRWKDVAARASGSGASGSAAAPVVKESDGSATTADFFTVLNVGQFYTEAQVLNMNAYSVLRTWLTSVKVSNVKYVAPLLDAVLEYCSRTLLQAEKTATKDADLVLAVLVESTNLLDVVATVSEAHRSRCVTKVKAIDCRDTSSPHVLMAVLQFFLNHAKDQAPYVIDRLFGGSLAGHFMDSSVAFELVSFIRRNLACLCYDTACLKVYFPSVFKVLAWNPPCYLDDFVVILPAVLCKQTALELIHYLLDLPCLSAALGSSGAALASAQQPTAAVVAGSARAAEVTTGGSSSSAGGGDLPAALRPWLTYLLRSKAGSGDTIAKLHVLHSGLASLADHHRVACSVQASLVLVRKFFQHFLEYCEVEAASHMLQLVLERVCLLYGPAHFQRPMQRLLCDEILRLLDKYPQLIALHKPDILSWLVSTKVATTNTLVCTHLAWAVGYYCSPAYGSKYTVEMMTEFYETMECLVYETISSQSIGSMPAATAPHVFGEDSVQLLTTVVTAMAKLACRSHDLVPRVLLCISKLSKLVDASTAAVSASSAMRFTSDCASPVPSDNPAILRGRLRELVNLINVPDVASTILNMSIPSKLNRPHVDSTAPHALLETLSALM